MFIRLLHIIALSSIVFSQSYFDRILGENIQFGDARSMSLANTYISTGTSSSITAVNPARLSYLVGGTKGMSIDFQLMSRVSFERRSIGFFDNFGDYKGVTDHVSNQSSNFYNSLGIIMSSSEIKKSNFAIGFSFMPLASFNYVYQEEVRGEETFYNGELIGVKDPLVGFHRYQNKGEINLFSLGFGYSINRVLKSSIEDIITIDNYPNSSNSITNTNLSNVQNLENKSNTPYDTYETFSVELPFPYSKKSSFVFSVETSAMIQSDDYSDYDNSELSGLPHFLEYNADVNGDGAIDALDIIMEDSNGLNPEYIFILKGVEFYKPKKMTFGLRLDKYKTLFVFEINREFYNRLDEDNYDNLLNDISHYRFGFEHRFKLGSTIRMGLLYKESIMNGIDPITQFTLGSNKAFNKNLNLDFALSYYITSYKYDDIFPISYPYSNTLDCSLDCEIVTESSLSISTTIKWKF